MRKLESSRRQRLGKSIGILVFGGDEFRKKRTTHNLISDKVKVYFNVLCTSMEQWIARWMYCPSAIAQCYQHKLQPLNFYSSFSESFEFCLCSTSSNCLLLFSAPRNQVRAQIDTVSSNRLSDVTIFYLIGVAKGPKLKSRRWLDWQSMMCNALQITQDSFDSGPLRFLWTMHIFAHFVDS